MGAKGFQTQGHFLFLHAALEIRTLLSLLTQLVLFVVSMGHFLQSMENLGNQGHVEKYPTQAISDSLTPKKLVHTSSSSWVTFFTGLCFCSLDPGRNNSLQSHLHKAGQYSPRHLPPPLQAPTPSNRNLITNQSPFPIFQPLSSNVSRCSLGNWRKPVTRFEPQLQPLKGRIAKCLFQHNSWHP